MNHPTSQSISRAMVRTALLAGAGLLCCACSQPSVTLKDPDSGAVVACKGDDLAGGFASSGVVDELMTRCIDGYTNRGYEIIASNGTGHDRQ